MLKTTVERQDLIEAVSTLPENLLVELATFVDYLHYKTVRPQSSELPQQNFLLAVAGLGQSGQSNISDSDEEILRNEIHRIEGWNNKVKN